MSYLDLFKNPDADKPESPPVIFAATDMTVVTIRDYRASGNSVIENGKCYRRLTPEYWAWFYHKYYLMEQALVNGKISEATFVEILNRISALYNHALALHGRDAIKHAEANLDFKEYDSRLKCDGTQTTGHSAPKTTSKVPRLVVSR